MREIEKTRDSISSSPSNFHPSFQHTHTHTHLSFSPLSRRHLCSLFFSQIHRPPLPPPPLSTQPIKFHTKKWRTTEAKQKSANALRWPGQIESVGMSLPLRPPLSPPPSPPPLGPTSLLAVTREEKTKERKDRPFRRHQRELPGFRRQRRRRAAGGRGGRRRRSRRRDLGTETREEDELADGGGEAEGEKERKNKKNKKQQGERDVEDGRECRG